MGRPRKPLVTQRGNLTVLTMQNRKREEDDVKTGKNQLKRPPDWLIDDVAKKEWRRIVKELESIHLVGNLDRNNLGGYCNAFANYVKATNILKDQTYYIDRETRNGVIVVKNPMVDIQKTYADEMRRFASLCGLTIDSRLKAAATRTTKTEEEMERKFGGI
ncbi:MAG: phage terminase small subunit P27 family [Ruminococcus sp.]|nr:phage terminase small subunit P27 family [Ruminococcus sp.]